MGSTAYLDEAFSAGPVGIYVVAAVLVASAHADELRLDLRQLFGRRTRPRFHWHSEDETARQQMLGFIVAANVASVSVSICLSDPRAQERARGLALDRVLWELMSRQAGRLILEARQERNNQRDRRRIAAAQRAGKASADLTYNFGIPKAEPLLWMADAIAGAVLAVESGRNRSMIAVIKRLVERINL